MSRFVFTSRALIGVLLGLALSGCGEDSSMLAPYQGARPLTWLTVTQSYQPGLQWVGGRAATVGINRGTKAALDSTLVWLMVAPDNTIGSNISLGEAEADLAALQQYGGVPTDSLADDTPYTFWVAERSAFEAGLDSTQIDPASFADTTFTVKYLLRGRSGGDPDLDVAFKIFRDQTLRSDQYVITWSPAVPFRRLAIRQATVGGFSNLVWHIVVPEEDPPGIVPPLVLGEVPEGTVEAVEWAGGFEASAYVLWAVTDAWEGSDFGFRTPGYAFFQIFSNNFE